MLLECNGLEYLLQIFFLQNPILFWYNKNKDLRLQWRYNLHNKEYAEDMFSFCFAVVVPGLLADALLRIHGAFEKKEILTINHAVSMELGSLI